MEHWRALSAWARTPLHLRVQFLADRLLAPTVYRLAIPAKLRRRQLVDVITQSVLREL